jgi:hypothetical protein
MKKIVLFTTLISVLFLFTRCKKEPVESAKLLGEIRFTEDELSYVPYEMDDTLKFKNNSGVIITFWVTSKIKELKKLYEDAGNYNSNYHYTEELTVQFTDNNGYSQKIRMRTQNEIQRTFVETSFSPPNSVANDSALKTFWSYMDGNKFSTSSDIYHPNITIGGNTFYTVYELVDNFDPYQNINNLNRIYFAKNRGIVAMKTKSDEEWVLED